MQKRCVLIAGGAVSPTQKQWLRADDVIFAVDAGYLQATKLGVQPRLCIGDWDSCLIPQQAEELIVLPPEKDDTDTYHAARIAVERGFQNVLILGGLGGRLDHTLANISTLLYLREAGVTAILADEDTEITVLHNETRSFARRCGFYFSIFAQQGTAQGVTLRGVKYPVQNAAVRENYPIGVSNEILLDTAEVTVKNGTLLVLYARR
ncbi:MAG: thiamine diphosphokinase [Pygmaiobacter sp.]